MNKKNRTWLIIGVVIVLAVLWGVRRFNSIVTLEEAVTKSWSDVESSYQRRSDLIPNLQATVKGYADFEQETLTQVIEARAKATSININADNLNAQSMAAFQQAQDGLGSALSRLLVTIERYPDLKANQNFLSFQTQLEGTENRINVHRIKFNETARAYNTAIKRFPGRIIAGMGNFEEKAYFEAVQGAEAAPVVEF